MPKMTLDGQELVFEGKKTILQVAIDHGMAVPHYCYHPGLSVVASCRICLAEVAQPNPRNDNKLELIPKLMPTCQTPATDGMVVHTQSPKSVANQKAVMEYLLINHPLDCPVCDQAGECSLQDYSYEYGRSEARFQEDKIKQPVKDIGPHVKLYSDRCIMCSRCVRFTREITGTGELGVFGRGNREQIDVFPGRPLDNELSGNVVDICPVGALLDKDFLFTQRVWFLQEAASIDGLTASGDNISIHHNEGRVYRIKPRTNLDINQWWISDEIRYGWKFIHSDARLKQPQRQQYGTQVGCDWERGYEDACDLIRKTISEKGVGSVALLVSPMLSCEDAHLLGTLVQTIDPQSVMGMGPVPVQGEDKTFPSGYTIRAEKCPNSRGVSRVLESIKGDAKAVLSFADWCKALSEKTSKVSLIVVTGNYPSKWTTKELTTAVAKKAVILLDTLPNDLSSKADIVFPTGTWAEKQGTFENAQGKIQAFDQAIALMEDTRSEGRIALDILGKLQSNTSRAVADKYAAAVTGDVRSGCYDAAVVRQVMGGVFVSQVKVCRDEDRRQADMQYVEL